MAVYRKSIEVSSDNYCCYGCGNKVKFLSPGGKEMCESSANRCPSNKGKNSAGLKASYASGARKPSRIVYQNLSQESKDRMNWNKGNYSADFCYNGKGSHKQVLIQERGHRCERCGLSDWQGSPITLELEHIDGDNRNNDKGNLKLLCPNCHSMTDTWRGRNKNSGKIKVSDDELINAISQSTSIRQALLSVGLAAKGDNYKRCHDMIYGGVVKLATTSDLSSDASA